MSAQAQNPRAFWPHVVALVLLLIAIPQHDSTGYYSIARWVVCAAFLLLALEAHQLHKQRWVWVWGVLAGIFNPIVPVHATRELWIIVDVIAIGIVAFDLFVKHESLARFRQIIAAALKWVVGAAIRLLILVAALVITFFVLDFVITRWG